MAFDLERFYQELDAHYARHDNAATEEFLTKSKAQAQALSDVCPIRTGCTSCVEGPEVNLELVSVCNELACFYRGLSRWEESLATFEEARRELETYYQSQTPNYAAVLLNMAGVLRLMGRLEEAEESFQKAAAIFEANGLSQSYHMAGVHNNLALVYQDRGELDKAAGEMEAALAIIEGLENNAVELGTTYNNLAVAYAGLGRQADADAAISKSISILETLDCGVNPHYPAALNTQGLFAYRAGDYEKAAACMTAALEKTEQVYGKNVEYAIGCRNCAQVFEKLGDTEKAARYQAEAAPLCEKYGV
jgi:tetratricopeptide (TPR) repeat protein